MAPTYTGPRNIASQAAEAFRGHWPEYLMEAALPRLFMVSACVFAVLLEYPGSERAIPDSVARRLVGASAMGLTAAIYQLRHGTHGIFCAKLHHHNQQRCIFLCRYASL